MVHGGHGMLLGTGVKMGFPPTMHPAEWACPEAAFALG